MSDNTILVTGAAGFIGFHVAQRLLSAGREVIGLDVVNSYYDGPLEPGKEALGGFYEVESSSPAAALAPGKSLTHVHRTLHFMGKRADLDPLAKAALGVSLDRVIEATKP